MFLAEENQIFISASQVDINLFLSKICTGAYNFLTNMTVLIYYSKRNQMQRNPYTTMNEVEVVGRTMT